MSISRITKREIINAGLSGLPVYGEWVCKIKRGSKGRVLIERHNWETQGESPVGNAVSRASHQYAREISRKLGGVSVEIYSSDGCMLDQVWADDEDAQ